MNKVILIVVFLFVLKPILPVLDYAINYDYITKELCENKAKPQMKCNGKCHLMKELAKASTTENPTSSDKKASHLEFETLFIEKLTSFELTNFNFSIQKKINAKYSNFYFLQRIQTAFHPPTILLLF